MFLTGFADEAGAELDLQIKATQELNWRYIETRSIGKKNLSSLTDAEFDEFCEKLDQGGVKVSCFGSGIANWGKHPRKEEDFEASKKELLNAIPRMKKLGIPIVRGMSFLTPEDERPDNPELEKIIFAKVGELAKICEDNGIIYGHENCMNYGGLSYLHTLKLLDHVKSPAFKLIFDTGNPVFNPRFIGGGPYPMQSAWEFYKNVREFIAYVHIKDGTALPEPGNFRALDCRFCYAGDGNGDVRAIMIDLRETGYDGGFSIEPHIASVFHEKNKVATREEAAYASYIEYGRRFEKLLTDCGWRIPPQR